MANEEITRRNPLGEPAAIAKIAARTGQPDAGEVWVGDDTAVLRGASPLLLATDVLVEGVHFRRDFGTLADAGWKALVCNLSDVAAMGGTPLAAVIGLVGAGGDDLDPLYDGLQAAGAAFGCPIVGGDLSHGPCLVISVGILGTVETGSPVLRSGGRPGDRLFLTAPVGGASAGLRALRADATASGATVEAHRRPVPRLEEGRVAARSGATAMIDVSDGLGIDLDRLCVASGVGASLDRLWVAPGATVADAMGGGDDYELLFSAPSADVVARAFGGAGLRQPMELGSLVEAPEARLLEGEPFAPTGYVHGMG